MTNNNLIILAGGMSSRMKKPSTSKNVNEEDIKQANNRSKSLISVGNEGRPLMDYLLYNAKKAGYKNIYIVINKEGQLFKEFYGLKKEDNLFNGLHISFPIQHIPEDRIKPFGTADAVLQALNQFPKLKKEQFTICNSDNLYSENSLRAIRENNNKNVFIAYDRDALKFPISKIYSFAIANLDSNNYLKSIIEKPTEEEAKEYKDEKGKIRVSMNIFKLDGKIAYPLLRDCPIHPIRNEKELPTVVLNIANTSENNVFGIPLSEHVPDLTAKDDIILIKEYLKKHYDDNLIW